MVWDNQPEGAIHLFDGSHLPAIQRKRLLQVLGSMDAFGIHNCNHREKLQLGSNNLQKIKHLCVGGSDVEGRRGTNLLHGLVLT
jgi:hypothetical protein